MAQKLIVGLVCCATAKLKTCKLTCVNVKETLIFVN